MIYNKGKKGELTTKQLVTIIILIASFIIILFLLFRLNLGETGDKEICHNSVVLREKSGALAGPLDCKTNYVCISGGGDCEGISATSTIKVNPANKTAIMNAIAKEMSDCWWMFGEGEVNYAGGDLASKTTCSICSILEFEDISIDSISYEEFYNHLKTTPKTIAQTYLQYLYSIHTLSDIENDFPLEGYLLNNIEPDKTYFILTGISRSIVWGFFGTNHFPVVILERIQENYEEIGCDVFLTKA